MLPGIPLIFGGIWLAAAVDHYQHVGSGWLIAIGSIAAVGLVLDLTAAALGAKRVGASARAVSGALIGTLVGLFFGIPGLIAGPFIGALVGELSAGGSLQRSTACRHCGVDRSALRHPDQVGGLHHDGGAVRGSVVVESAARLMIWRGEGLCKYS